MRTALSNIAVKTGSNLPGDLLMTAAHRTSLPAVQRLVALADDVCYLARAGELLRRAVFGALRRFNVLRRCVLTVLPLALPRRLIASSEAQERAS